MAFSFDYLDSLRHAVEIGMAALPCFGVLPQRPDPITGFPSCSCRNPSCGDQAGKHPRLPFKHWDRVPNWNHVRNWLEQFGEPPAYPINWAFHLRLSCGTGLVVLDTDPRNGALDSWTELAGHGFATPRTPRDAIEGRGWHEWFLAPPADYLPEKAFISLAPGIDLKTNTRNGYVIGPPSLHRCGKPYLWDASAAPWEIPFAPLPQWVIDMANERIRAANSQRAERMSEPKRDVSSQPATHAFGCHHDEHDRIIERARAYLARADGAVSGQHGHNRTFNVACKLVNGFELPACDALYLMREWNQKCSPPWSDAELQHKIDDAAREPGPRGYLLHAQRRNDTDLWPEEIRFLQGARIVSSVRRDVAQEEECGGDGACLEVSLPVADDLATTIPADDLAAAAAAARSRAQSRTRRISESQALAATRDAYRDPNHPCCNPRPIINEDIATRCPELDYFRCEHRIDCPGCRCYLIERDMQHAQLRIGQHVHGGGQLYELNCRPHEWGRLRRQLRRLGGQYWRQVEATDAEDGHAPTLYWVLTTVPVAGSIRVWDGADGRQVVALQTVEDLLHAYQGSRRPISTSRRWRRQRSNRPPRLRRIGRGHESLTDRLVEELVEFANPAASIEVFRSANPASDKLVRGQRFRGPWTDRMRSHLYDMLMVGETLPDIVEWRTRGGPRDGARDGRRPPPRPRTCVFDTFS